MPNKKAVLIAEESLAMVQLYKGLLAAYKCIVHPVSSIAEARERMIHYDYDLYIIDTNLENGEDGTELVGRGGAKPNKCLILSGNLPEEKVTELVEFHKVPRNMIMIKPPDAQAFIAIAKKPLSGGTSDDGTILVTEVNEVKPTIIQKVKGFFGKMTIKGWLTLLCFLLLLPTTIKTTGLYISYREHNRFHTNIAEYYTYKFEDFVVGEKVTINTYVEHTVKGAACKYIIRAYPGKVIRVNIIPNDLNKKTKEYWLAGPEYLKTLGLSENMTFVDILKSATKF